METETTETRLEEATQSSAHVLKIDQLWVALIADHLGYLLDDPLETETITGLVDQEVTCGRNGQEKKKKKEGGETIRRRNWKRGSLVLLEMRADFLHKLEMLKDQGVNLEWRKRCLRGRR